MTKSEEVLEALRADRLCTLCNFNPPDDWSVNECHVCAHEKRTGLSLPQLASRCQRCRNAWFASRP